MFNNWREFHEFITRSPFLGGNRTVYVFKQNVNLLKHGCACKTNTYKKMVNDSYIKLKFEPRDIENIKSKLLMDRVEFYQEDDLFLVI